MNRYIKITIILVPVITLVFFLSNNKKEEIFNKIRKESGIYINGNYIKYINLNDQYIEDYARAYDSNGNDISDKINVSYFEGSSQVFKIDTRFPNYYIVRYSIANNNIIKEASRIVIISDVKAPTINKLEPKYISEYEANIFDVNEGVTATDNLGKAKVECDNSLSSLQGSYYIKCKASDNNGNIMAKKRKIKVYKGIHFIYNDGIKIIFPKGKFTYKYSLDGGETFTNCSRIEKLNITKGTIIASVYQNEKLLTSNTFVI